MSDVTVSSKEEIIRELDKLDKDQLNEVLQFTRRLTRPRGEPGHLLVQHAREIQFPREDLEEMKRIIEEDHEQIDADEWDSKDFPA